MGVMFYPKFKNIWYKNLICNLKLVTAAINVQVWISRTFNVSVRTIQNMQRARASQNVKQLVLVLVINFLVRSFILFK